MWPPTGRATSPTARPPWPCWSRRAPRSTPASAAAATTRPHCTGRPAATTSRSWTRCRPRRRHRGARGGHRRRHPAHRRAGLRAVASRPPAGRARGQDHHRRRGHPRPPGPAGGLLRRDRSGPRRGQPRLLGRLPRRPAPLRRVPAGTGRRPQLDPALGAADPAGRGRPQRRRRTGRLAAHAGSQAGRRVAASGLGRRRGGTGWPQKLPVQAPSMVAAQLRPANTANSSTPTMVANPAVQRSSSATRSSMSPPFRVGRRSGGGWRSRRCRGGRTWW